jgi:adenosylmethionine-8-amino-7-oxononanoate aminotransferase
MLAQNANSHVFFDSGRSKPLFGRAEGIFAWDGAGKRYIDGASGAMVCNLGHVNARVVEAMKSQLDRGAFAYRLHFENEPALALADKVAKLAIGDLECCYFVSGGSEAVETTIKLARQFVIAKGEADRFKVISRFPGYHGTTFGALALTGYDPLTRPFAPMMNVMPKIPAPTCHLDRDNLTPEERGIKYADMLEEEIQKQGSDTVLAFIMEPVGGASTGALVAPDSYYGRIREICDRHGVLLIYDEVMSGGGRTGTFLAAEHWQIVPDLVAVSKGFGAGYCPLGAAIAPRRIVDAVMSKGGFQHGHTYAGNPLACTAGLAVLQEMERLDLYSNAARMGERVLAGLDRLRARFPFVGHARGKGLLTAIELVRDRETMEPLPAELKAHQRVIDLAFEKGVILYSRRTRGGDLGDHVMVCPPLIVDADQVDEILNVLEDSLSEFADQSKLGRNSG